MPSGIGPVTRRRWRFTLISCLTIPRNDTGHPEGRPACVIFLMRHPDSNWQPTDYKSLVSHFQPLSTTGVMLKESYAASEVYMVSPTYLQALRRARPSPESGRKLIEGRCNDTLSALARRARMLLWLDIFSPCSQPSKGATLSSQKRHGSFGKPGTWAF